MISLALIDDHPIVRDGLIAVLSDEPDFQVLFAAPSAEEATHLLRHHQPAVTLLDLELPGASGIEALPTLLQAAPHTKVIVFTAYDTEERVLGALRAGAKGYLLIGATSEEIARAIRTVHAGGTHLSPRIATTVVAQLGHPAGARSRPTTQGPTTHLTPREREVLQLVANGRSNKEIARTLSITERTAKFHVTSLLNKLGAENRARAAALGVQRGLL